jgi:hypothetical protein
MKCSETVKIVHAIVHGMFEPERSYAREGIVEKMHASKTKESVLKSNHLKNDMLTVKLFHHNGRPRF